jgi:hypothetical protein
MITFTLASLAVLWLVVLRLFPQWFAPARPVRQAINEYHFGGRIDDMPVWKKKSLPTSRVGR